MGLGSELGRRHYDNFSGGKIEQDNVHVSAMGTVKGMRRSLDLSLVSGRLFQIFALTDTRESKTWKL